VDWWCSDSVSHTSAKVPMDPEGSVCNSVVRAVLYMSASHAVMSTSDRVPTPPGKT